jgi:hypothetical protein
MSWWENAAPLLALSFSHPWRLRSESFKSFQSRTKFGDICKFMHSVTSFAHVRSLHATNAASSCSVIVLLAITTSDHIEKELEKLEKSKTRKTGKTAS